MSVYLFISFECSSLCFISAFLCFTSLYPPFLFVAFRLWAERSRPKSSTCMRADVCVHVLELNCRIIACVHTCTYFCACVGVGVRACVHLCACVHVGARVWGGRRRGGRGEEKSKLQKIVEIVKYVPSLPPDGQIGARAQGARATLIA